jgi:MSHA biogenesis protein MshQ
VPNFPDLTDDFTITGWIRTTDNTKSGQRIFIDDEQVGAAGCGSTLSCLGYGLTLGDAGTGKLRFYSRGSSVVNLDSAAVINNNTWYFVAAVADIANGQRKLYVYDNTGGVLGSASVNSTWPATAVDDGDTSIGGTLPTSTQATSSYHFRGNLDDIRVYGKVLAPAALAQLAQTSQACATAGPNHLQIEHATGTGLTCAASTLTIRACADAAPACSPYSAGVSGALSASGSPTISWDGSSGGAAGSGFVIPSGSSAVSKNVQVGSAGSVVFGIANSSPAAPGPTSCTFGTPACTFTASTAGFIFGASATGTSASIPTQTAGTATSAVYLRAVQASTANAAVCTPAIAGQSNVAVTMGYTCNNPSSCQPGNYLNVNSTGVPASGGIVSLNFDANGASQLGLRYDDVGQITLSASKAATPVSGGTSVTLTGASNAFVVRPATLAVSSVSATASAPRPGGGLVKAGESFSATITAQNALGATTPSFGKEGATVLLAPALATPPTGNNPAIGNGTIPGSEFGATGMSNDVSGTARVTNLTWTEVGSITLTPSVSDYLSTGAVTGTASSAIGRFYPDHFAVSGSPTVTPSCGFAYFGQSSAVTVSAIVEARNLADSRTQNYASGYAAALAGVTLVGADSANGIDQSARLSQIACSWSAGQCAVSGNTSIAKSTSTPNAPDNPFAAFQLGLKITDATDGGNFGTFTMNPATAGSCSAAGTCNAQSIGAAFPVRFGQLALFPGYGSELAAMAVPMQLQYWNGSAFVLNGLDTCTSVTPAMVSLSGWSGNLSAGSTSVSSVAAFSGGKSSIRLAAPGAGKTGRVGVGIGLTTNGTSHLWVKPQGGSSFSADPATTANFGLFKASPNLIHLRESY